MDPPSSIPCCSRVNATNLGTTRRDFADGIKVTNQLTLKYGDTLDCPRLSGSLSVITRVLKRRRGRLRSQSKGDGGREWQSKAEAEGEDRERDWTGHCCFGRWRKGGTAQGMWTALEEQSMAKSQQGSGDLNPIISRN